MKRGVLWLILGVLFLPAFSLMLRPGIFSMHDPHLFRIFEFNNCIRDAVFPCRWSANSSMGYGAPLFSFYAQAPYWLTQIFLFLGSSVLDSAKISYILSLVLSGFTMFIFARRYWGTAGGLISALFYVYAPYRAVDVWVRGALPEALAFIFYPLILLFLDLYLESDKISHLLYFSLLLALLITIHNLSFLMFLPFLAVYWVAKGWHSQKLNRFWVILPAGLFSLALSAFYLLPVILESPLVTLGDTVKDYYDYHIHFTTLHELFISRFWGYGASLWQKKYLSVSIGHLHWITPILLLPVSLISSYKLKAKSYQLFLILGFSALFLTHGKSSFIWDLIPPMKFIQFPWRFLTIAVFFLSLSSGYIGKIIINSKHLVLLITLLILINFSFFRPDNWHDVTDREQFSGRSWDEGRSSSLTDFWPGYGSMAPDAFAPDRVEFIEGEGRTLDIKKQSHSSQYLIYIDTPQARINLPQVYFPGWTVRLPDRPVDINPSQDLGLVQLSLPSGEHSLKLRFTDTPVRRVGNLVSLLSISILIPGLFYLHLIHEKRLG